MIPITTLTKISNYVDRYFVRFYKVYKNELTNQCLNQYAFQHTNKYFNIHLIFLFILSSEKDYVWLDSLRNTKSLLRRRKSPKSPLKRSTRETCKNSSEERRRVLTSTEIPLFDYVFAKIEGGIKSTPNKTIGEIFCEDGSIYEVKGVIDGNVIELNDNLLTNPTWITDYVSKNNRMKIKSKQYFRYDELA